MPCTSWTRKTFSFTLPDFMQSLAPHTSDIILMNGLNHRFIRDSPRSVNARGTPHIFENYDAIGAYRTEENGIPVDSSGTLVTPDGGFVSFSNAVELLTALSGAYEVDRCLAEHWFEFMLGRDIVEAERASFETAYRAAGAGPSAEFSLREFIVQALQTTAFRMRTPSE